MNSCMLQYQNQDELDKARLEWFALAEERRQVCDVFFGFFLLTVFGGGERMLRECCYRRG
jgi:hypothetical protein